MLPLISSASLGPPLPGSSSFLPDVCLPFFAALLSSLRVSTLQELLLDGLTVLLGFHFGLQSSSDAGAK